MSDDAAHEEHVSGELRTTAPMQEFTMGQVWIGLVVLAVGLLVVFGLPLVF